MKIILSISLLLATLTFTGAALSQPNSSPLSSEYKADISRLVIDLLRSEYVLPEKAEIAAIEIQRRLTAGEFDEITDLQTFANRLTGTLDIIEDWHLGVNYYPEPIPEDYNYWDASEEEAKARSDYIERRNFGFEKVERLAGNIGYIELRNFFFESPHSESALASAMEFISHTDGLLIDLRRNGGGQGELVELFISYLTDERLLISTTNYRENNREVEHWTVVEVQGEKYSMDKPVYILTSNRTFSAAEAFTYALQSLDRVTVVGEVSIGGAHPFENIRIDDHLMIRMPIAESIDPRTGTNWQYVGIQPDQEVNSTEALDLAYQSILQELIDSGSDSENIREKAAVLRNLENN